MESWLPLGGGRAWDPEGVGVGVGVGTGAAGFAGLVAAREVGPCSVTTNVGGEVLPPPQGRQETSLPNALVPGEATRGE